ncbi:IS3 family transposase [Paenibacillus sp. FSL H7-0331]|uniref:IS3 family transposase n=1 Tax=Paenibacillus sp. FSL H7-0331 TaxID=1920421 RepID=UPI0009F944A6
MLWGNLKMEWLNDYTFKTRAEVRKTVFEYIELFITVGERIPPTIMYRHSRSGKNCKQ